jgi:hypothetical protein
VAALDSDLGLLLGGIGLLGPLLLAVGLRFSWTPAIPASQALLGAVYAAALLLRDGGVDGGAPFIGAAALLAAELSYWAAASHVVPLERPLVRRTLATSGALALVAFCLGIVLLLVGGAGVSGGLPLEALGVAAAAAALAVVVRLARA